MSFTRQLLVIILICPLILLNGCSPNAAEAITTTQTQQTTAQTLSELSNENNETREFFVSPTAKVSATPIPTVQPSATATPSPTPEPVWTKTPEINYNAPYQSEHCKDAWCTFPGHFLLSLPIPDEFNNDIDNSYRYGTTQNHIRETHHGVEFSNPSGTPVLAAADGKVLVAGDDLEVQYGEFLNFYGNLVIIEHNLPELDYPIFTLYAHLSRIDVKPGENVTTGQVIGAVGTSGTALGSHLHFEVRVKNNTYESTQNPDLWLKYYRYTEIRTQNGTLVVKLNYENDSIYTISILIENFTEPENPYHEPIYTESYSWQAPQHPVWDENLVVSDLKPGTYRVSFIREDRSFREFFDIEPGKLTFIEFKIN